MSISGNTMRPSILIADDHRLFAEGISSLLSASYEVVGIATDGRELTELAGRCKPDLILTDLSTPGPSAHSLE